MTATLDTILTVTIGRNDQDGHPLLDDRWDTFQSRVVSALGDHGTVVCHALSVAAVGSDGVNAGEPEDSAVFVTVLDPSADELGLRRTLAEVGGAFGQSTVTFAVDHLHEPVFTSTADGFRPHRDDRATSRDPSAPTVEAVDGEARESQPGRSPAEPPRLVRGLHKTGRGPRSDLEGGLAVPRGGQGARSSSATRARPSRMRSRPTSNSSPKS